MKYRPRKVPLIPQSKKELKDKWRICPKCKKTIGQLLASGLIISSRKTGARCANCKCNLVRGMPARNLSEKERKKLTAEIRDLIVQLERELCQ